MLDELNELLELTEEEIIEQQSKPGTPYQRGIAVGKKQLLVKIKKILNAYE